MRWKTLLAGACREYDRNSRIEIPAVDMCAFFLYPRARLRDLGGDGREGM